jgi:hypothetical protein
MMAMGDYVIANSKYSPKRLNHLNIKFRDEVILFNVLTDSIYLEGA